MHDRHSKAAVNTSLNKTVHENSLTYLRIFVQVVWRDRMDVPSRCGIVRTMGRSACSPEVPSGKNRAQNGGRP
jgi:hypothetical protein